MASLAKSDMVAYRDIFINKSGEIERESDGPAPNVKLIDRKVINNFAKKRAHIAHNQKNDYLCSRIRLPGHPPDKYMR